MKKRFNDLLQSGAGIGWVGFSVSALGSLAPGTLNLLSLSFSMQRGWLDALAYSSGATLIEMLFVAITLIATARVSAMNRLFYWLEWLTALIIFVIGVNLILMAWNTDPTQVKPNALTHVASPFLFGVSLRLLTPTCVPFWLGWNTLLISKNILRPGRSQNLRFTVGIGLGTMFSHGLYIVSGMLGRTWLIDYQHIVYWFIGILLCGTALWQVTRLIIGAKKKLR